MTPEPVLVLASASPSRLRLLQNSGVEPRVLVSGVDERALQALLAAAGTTDPASVCQALAAAKAQATAAALRAADPAGDARFVLGCDSVLDLDGEALGKPADAAEATARWHQMSGRVAQLRTGHHLIDLRTGAEVGRTVSTGVRFGRPDATELAAYVATGEPLAVAGAFTLDGLSGPFVQGVDGDPSNVIGLSLPAVRALLAELGMRWTDLWTDPHAVA